MPGNPKTHACAKSIMANPASNLNEEQAYAVCTKKFGASSDDIDNGRFTRARGVLAVEGVQDFSDTWIGMIYGPRGKKTRDGILYAVQHSPLPVGFTLSHRGDIGAIEGAGFIEGLDALVEEVAKLVGDCLIDNDFLPYIDISKPVELSIGYDCNIEEASPDEKDEFDFKQLEIRIDHVAIMKKNSHIDETPRCPGEVCSLSPVSPVSGDGGQISPINARDRPRLVKESKAKRHMFHERATMTFVKVESKTMNDQEEEELPPEEEEGGLTTEPGPLNEEPETEDQEEEPPAAAPSEEEKPAEDQEEPDLAGQLAVAQEQLMACQAEVAAMSAPAGDKRKGSQDLDLQREWAQLVFDKAKDAPLISPYAISAKDGAGISLSGKSIDALKGMNCVLSNIRKASVRIDPAAPAATLDAINSDKANKKKHPHANVHAHHEQTGKDGAFKMTFG